MSMLQALILSVVEGLTEYLPISSTGHLIITSSAMGIAEQQFTKDFTVIVQFGAILSVLLLYWRRFVTSRDLYVKLFVAFLPAALIGLAVKKQIDLLLDNVFVVGVTLLLGGIILLFADRWFARQEERLKTSGKGGVDTLTKKEAGLIGLIQCLAFVPGTSRSAASILGGLTQGLTRQAAAEFSFLLGVPTLTAATAWKVLKICKTGGFESSHLSLIIVGNIVSFIVGAIAIKGFISFLTRRGFFLFGVYRIIVGALLILWILTGHHVENL